MHLLKDHENYQKLVEIHASLSSPFLLPPYDPPLLLLRQCDPDLRQVIVTHLVWLYSHWMGVLSSDVHSEAVQEMTESAAKRGMYVLREVLRRLANEGGLWRATINPWQVQLLRHHERLAPFTSTTWSQREVIDATWGHNWTTTLNLRSQGRHFPVYELARHSQDFGLSLQQIKDELSRIQKDDQPSSLKTLKQLCGELEDMKKQVLAVAGKPDAERQWERPRLVELTSWRDLPRPRFLNDEPSLGRVSKETFESSGGRVCEEEALERLEQCLVRFGEERDGDEEEGKYSSPSPPRRPRIDRSRPPSQATQPSQIPQRPQTSLPMLPTRPSPRSRPSQPSQSSQRSQPSQPPQPLRSSEPSQTSQASRLPEPIPRKSPREAVVPPDIKPVIDHRPPIKDVIDLCDIPDSPPGSSKRKWESPPPSRSPPPIEVPTRFEGVWDVAVQKRVERISGAADTGEVLLVKNERRSSKTTEEMTRKEHTTSPFRPTTPLFSPAVPVTSLPPAESRKGPPTPVFSPAVPVSSLPPADNSSSKTKAKEPATRSRSSSPRLIVTPEYSPILGPTSSDAQIVAMQLDSGSTSQSSTEVFVSPMEEVEMAGSPDKDKTDSQERKRSSGEMSGEEEISKKRLKGSEESEVSATMHTARVSKSASPAPAPQTVPSSPVRQPQTSSSSIPVSRTTASTPTHSHPVPRSPTLSPAHSNARSYTITPTPPMRGQGDTQEASPDTEMKPLGNLLFFSSPSAPPEAPAGDTTGTNRNEDEETDYSDGESVDSDLWDQILRNDVPARPASPAIPSAEPQPAQDPAEPQSGIPGPQSSTGVALQSAEDRQMVDIILLRTRDGEIRSSTQEFARGTPSPERTLLIAYQHLSAEETSSPPRRQISEDGAARFAVHAESIRSYARGWTEGREVVCKIERGTDGRFRFGTTFQRFRDEEPT